MMSCCACSDSYLIVGDIEVEYIDRTVKDLTRNLIREIDVSLPLKM